MKDSKKVNTAAWAIISGIAIILLGWLLHPFFFHAENLTATIWVHNQKYQTIRLKETTDMLISLREDTGVDIVVEIKEHQIRFSHSDCPDQICVHAGFLKNETDSAICMPNQTAIFISNE